MKSKTAEELFQSKNGGKYSHTSVQHGETFTAKFVIDFAEEYASQFQNPVPAKEASKYPIGGYAPGNYMCNCTTCKAEFFGDKLAVQCEPCAIKMVHPVPDDAGEVYSKEQIEKLAWESWEQVNHELQQRGGVNPSPFILGFKYGSRLSPALPSGEDAGKGWISVETPPETDNEYGCSDYVLCSNIGLDNSFMFVGWYNSNDKKWTVAHHYSTDESARCTHWQPLPPKP